MGQSGVIIMFMGEYNHTIDEKGRVTVPSKLRDSLGYDFIITKGLDNCLFVYPKEEWNNIIKKYKELPNTKEARNFLRVFLSGANESNLDKQGRINITPSLMNFASLKKDCVIIGMNERLEIWSKENWEEFIDNNESNITEIADNLFQTNIGI